MKYRRLLYLVMAAILTLGLLAGCGGSDEDGGSSGGVLSGGADAESSEDASAADVPNDADTIVGTPVAAGPCELLVSRVERADKVGKFTAEDGILIAVYVQLTNISETGLNVIPTDFQLTDGESYTTALEDDPDLNPSGIIAPGETKAITAAFHVPGDIGERPLTFVYQSIVSGEAVHIEVPLQ